ncbi:hypothetical protein Clacol_008356 [Clathrus columnatus]|uniref:Uncharacterized protein n=1 Tax=Clathrus columnatus TaxID=1419009 RepID=A0AAV5AHJ5_9AGAM|nr:hypothetical protein Clacol_008356 [Clathrus columnatus]
MFTTSSIFLKTLAEAGVTHAFVNWGSDHPALLEDLQRQRVEEGRVSLEIITCPNEMVALSCAQGYAQVSGKPAAVFIHVDVGTQALGGAVHNVDRGRIPVLIYAGAAPFTLDGELKGSRNEFIFGLQDALDQPSIVRQYMRYTSQISSGKNVAQVVMRALQFAKSDPQGPVYLWGRREVMEEEYTPTDFRPIDNKNWPPLERMPISHSTSHQIAESLAMAESPLIITSYLGRNPSAVQVLIKLSEALAIPVYLSCPSSVSFPLTHPHFVGLSYGMGENKWLCEADVILVLDADIPWIPVHNRPKPDARIFHIDVDVLKQYMGMFHIDAQITAKADCELSLIAILDALQYLQLDEGKLSLRRAEINTHHETWVNTLRQNETLSENDSNSVPYLISRVRELVPPKTLFLNEGISNFVPVWSHLLPSKPGSVITSGASSLGWALGAAIGCTLAQRSYPEAINHELIAVIVGDGSFLFGVPSSAYWIANRYKTSPKLSMLGVYPKGVGSQAMSFDLDVTFGPESPDYSGVAIAAGKAWGKRVTCAQEIDQALKDAISVVLKEKRCAVLDIILEEL